MAFKKEAEIALNAVLSSLKLFKNDHQNLNTSCKETSRDIVTKYDIKIERHIINKLRKTNYKIIGEETRNIFNSFNLKERKEVCWIIDPIDGTVNFVNNLDYYGIAVSLCKIENENVYPLVSAFCMPKTKDLFFMDGESTSFWNGVKLTCPDQPFQDSLIVACFSSENKDPEFRRREYLTFGEINDSTRGALRLGSASTAICYTAASKFQATYGINVPVWDVMAGLAIARTAGCKYILHVNQSTKRLNFVVGTDSATCSIYNTLIKNNLWKI